MKRTLLLLVLLFATPSIGSSERADNTNTLTENKPLDESATVKRLTDRMDQIESALKSVQWEPHKSPGLDLPEQERKANLEFDKWMLATRQDLKAYVRNLDKILKRQKLDEAAVREIDQQWKDLQARLLKEIDQFTSISNVLKTRHETAKNSIGNIR
jgi:hypothetical protein